VGKFHSHIIVMGYLKCFHWRLVFRLNLASKHVALMGDRRSAYKIEVGKPEGRRPF
jgi:hypothetical protein